MIDQIAKYYIINDPHARAYKVDDTASPFHFCFGDFFFARVALGEVLLAHDDIIT